jgi:hypothetical protein
MQCISILSSVCSPHVLAQQPAHPRCPPAAIDLQAATTAAAAAAAEEEEEEEEEEAV